MVIEPQTEIRLLKTPLNDDGIHTLKFANIETQENYFNNLPKIIEDNCSYQREDNTLFFPANIDEIEQYNYCMYKNENYTDKWFYAFIINMEYENDEVTRITLKTDVFQTWQFDITYHPSFIDREHTNNDTIGANTIPEGLETGDYIVNFKNECPYITKDGYTFIVGATININKDGLDDVNGLTYGGVFSGVKYFSYDDALELSEVLTKVAKAGKSDAINCIFIAPKSVLGAIGNHELISTSCNIGEWGNNLTKPTSLNGYIPRNNKLLTYPYMYLLMSNHAGANATYKYELFNAENLPFSINASITPSMSISLVPLNYNGITYNYSEALPFGKYPICSWNTDVYTNWLTQNAVNVKIGVASAMSNMYMGVASGYLMGTSNAMTGATATASSVGNSIMQIGSILAERYQHSLQPPQAEGNINNGDVTFSSNNLNYVAYGMSIKYEMARSIDDYFQMFGYKTNRVKLPNLTGRQNFNYIKTIGLNITGNIPQKHLQEIKALFDRGITLWHNANNIYNYNVTNNIV